MKKHGSTCSFRHPRGPKCCAVCNSTWQSLENQPFPASRRPKVLYCLQFDMTKTRHHLISMEFHGMHNGRQVPGASSGPAPDQLPCGHQKCPSLCVVTKCMYVCVWRRGFATARLARARQPHPKGIAGSRRAAWRQFTQHEEVTIPMNRDMPQELYPKCCTVCHST